MDEDGDDVQFLYEKPAGPVLCHFCSEDLTKLLLNRKNSHYEAHSSEQVEAGPSSAEKQQRSKLSIIKDMAHHLKRKRSTELDETDKFWHAMLPGPPPPNHTPGCIVLLRNALIKSHAKNQTQKSFLCFPGVVHVSVEWHLDKSWGCGYRNYMMACTALMVQDRQPTYFTLLDLAFRPGVRKLQECIEDAWKHGFDEDGAKELKKLTGTTKWIGTAEIWVACSHLGIPANLVDFHLERQGTERLVRWIIEYFSKESTKQLTVNDALIGASPVVVTGRMPFILQHEGHSRTVVGYEKMSDGSINILVLDPSKVLPDYIRELALKTHYPTSSSVSPIHGHHKSPSTFLRHMLHPTSIKRQKSGESSRSNSITERVRVDHSSEVIIIDDSDEELHGSKAPPKRSEEVDTAKVLSYFRIKAGTLSRKKKYQILWFPLTDPLSDSEKLQRHEVMSMKLG